MTKSATKLWGKKVKASILIAALTVAERDGYERLSRRSVAAQAACSEPLVSYYFSTMAQLRRAVMRLAVRQSCLRTVAAGLAAGDAHARRAPAELKQKALATLG